MRRYLTSLALLAGIAPLTITAPAYTATADKPPPGIGIRLVDAPVASAADPRARSYIIDHLAPGTVIHRRVEVSNGSPTTARVSVYPGAAHIRDGTFGGAPGHTQNELAGWISLDRPALVLGAQQRAFVDVTITVPARASRGERYGVVWAEVTQAPTNDGITRVNRVGIRIYLDVGPGGDPRTSFAITSLTASRDSRGTPWVQATVHNTGERAIDLNARLTLRRGPGGMSAGPFTSPNSTTLGLGQSAPVSVPLNKAIPAGPWQAHVTVTSGLTKRTVQASVTFPAKTGAAAPVPVKSDGAHWWVWALTAALLLILMLTALAALLRHRANRETERSAQAGTDSQPR